MKHVAALAGVGIKTVSRVVNGEPNVSEETAARVWSAVRALDYHVDLQASSMRRAGGRTDTLGLLVSSVDNPFAAAITRAVEDVALTRDVAVFASSLDDDAAREELAVEAFLRRRVDGLILTTMSRSLSYLRPTLERGTPVVCIDREPLAADVDVVVSDNREGAASATRHLIAGGHRRIALIADRPDIQTAVDRRDGFLEALGGAGIPTLDIPVVMGVHDPESAYDAVHALLASENPPTAVVTAQNLITLGALRALQEAGARHTVALVGFDEVSMGDLLDPGVTVVRQDPQSIGRIAAERVFARIDGDESASQRHVVGTELVIRGSGEIRPRDSR
ncbi:LacI family DNA-binding transcriptional regulator [Microbacterium sp. B2969]|uniref:LacI family DNA-binding transcriptional regulator n=1 Tax=Microbacterium alkaliflavum TaxID=3248839 RepID=A0ABW7QAW2_9MICO